MLSLLSACLLSGCFLAGYEQRPRDRMDGGEAGLPSEPEAGASADAGLLHDGGHEAGAKDAAVDAGVRDAGSESDAATQPDASKDAASEPDTSVVPDPDAAVVVPDAGADAAFDPDAGDSGHAGMDGSPGSDAGSLTGDSGVADAGGDACGPSGCVVTQTCVGTECDLTCTEAPDPGNAISLDCRYDCLNSNRCATTCSYANSCETDCTLTNVCRSTCPLGSACTTYCTGVTDCGGTCNTGSNCQFTCTASTCTQISCAFGAACRVKCTGGTCDFAFCGNVLSGSCSDGSIVCGRLCP